MSEDLSPVYDDISLGLSSGILYVRVAFGLRNVFNIIVVQREWPPSGFTICSYIVI